MTFSFSPKPATPRKQTSPGCLMLFALPFAGVGVFMTLLIGRTLWHAREAAGWREVPAMIQSVESHGSGENAVETRATYKYEVDGRTYTGGSSRARMPS